MKEQVLKHIEEIKRPSAHGDTFPAIALLQLAEGRVERAIEYYAYSFNFGWVAKSTWNSDVVGCHIENAAEALAPEIVAAVQERGRNLDPYKAIKELLVEMETNTGNGQR